jgi:magnesium chelatase family protein
MHSNEIRKYCKVDESGQELLKNAITKLGLSARTYDRILKVARSEQILPEYVAEAIQYRSLDRQLWP